MAPRPIWKGYLKLSLVTCAIELTSATSQSDKVHFRILDRRTGNTVKRQYVDSVTGKPVADDDQVKGYEIGKDEFLLIEEEEIDAVEIESSRTLSLDGFVPKASVSPIYLDTPYYMTPGDEVSEEAFAVIRQAMEDKKMAGLARIVLFRREHPVLVEPYEEGMLLTTLRYDKTVRKPEDVLVDLKDAALDDGMVDMAVDIVKRKKRTFEPSTFRDRYEDALVEMIDAKQKGRKPAIAKPASQPSNVVNLFDALKKSLASDKERNDKAPSSPAKTATRKKPTGSKSSGKSSASSGKRRKSA